MLLGVFNSSIKSNLCTLGNGFDDRLLFRKEGQTRIGTCQIVPWPRQDVIGDQSILCTPFNLEPSTGARRIAELLSLFVDMCVFATLTVADAKGPSFARFVAIEPIAHALIGRLATTRRESTITILLHGPSDISDLTVEIVIASIRTLDIPVLS